MEDADDGRSVGSGARPMGAKEFQQLSEFIQNECGIKLPPAKKTMLEARLQKRLRVLGFHSFGEYCSYLFSSTGLEAELTELLNVVTTNTTHFFREPKHFDVLGAEVLAAWSARTGNRREFRAWSAGCSTGEEPYTLAMVLLAHQEASPGFRFSVTATDISTRVLQQAVRGVYSEDKVEDLPQAIMRKHFMRSKDRTRRLVKVAPEVRNRVVFQRLNFMEEFRLEGEPMDVVFCRNVLIYFERATQEAIVAKLCRHLRPGGWLFIGHSESLTGMRLPLHLHSPTIYQRRRETGEETS
jgi:chemotaxis protein methyltransferase CheR